MKSRSKIIVRAITLVFLFTIIFSLPIWQNSAQAQGTENIIGGAASTIGNAVALILSWILWVPMMAIAQFSLVIVHLLVQASQFDNFINVNAVGIGWQTMRDLCNMFFIIILLLISFGTVLGIETWNYRRLLGRLIVAAVLINFSKMICGLLIDFSQIIMGTFVNAFKDTAPAILVNATGWDKMISMQGAMGKDITNMSLGGTMILNMFFILISFIVILAIFLILVVRIVMLWFLIIFSPIVWIGGLVPAMSGYVSQWWKQFTQWIIVGPILVFLLWFSLLMFQSGDVAKQAGGEAIAKSTKEGAITASLNDLSDSENTLNYAFSIAMLLMSLVFAQQLAGKAGSAIVGWSKKAGMAVAMGATAVTGGSAIGRWARDSAVGSVKARRDWALEKFPLLKSWTKEGQESTRTMREAKIKEKFGFGGAVEAAQQTFRTKAKRKLDEDGWLSSSSQRSKALQKHKEGSPEYEAILMSMAEEGDFAGRGGNIEKKAGYNRIFANTLHEKSKKHDFATGISPWEHDKDLKAWKPKDISKAIQGKVRGMRVHELEGVFAKIENGASKNVKGEIGDSATVDKILGLEDMAKFSNLSRTTQENILKAIPLALVNRKEFNLNEGRVEDLKDKYKELSGNAVASITPETLGERVKDATIGQSDNMEARFEELEEAKVDFKEAGVSQELHKKIMTPHKKCQTNQMLTYVKSLDDRDLKGRIKEIKTSCPVNRVAQRLLKKEQRLLEDECKKRGI